MNEIVKFILALFKYRKVVAVFVNTLVQVSVGINSIVHIASETTLKMIHNPLFVNDFGLWLFDFKYVSDFLAGLDRL